ncbi:hypothetical protein GYMLUDRAFT_183639 [Collybiopsis luxurians FD-317 M1]|uniref:Uncharacterized protein n=1 Tax=Collybiopsis luxurians FD-317 M1 TaxID=944289 RepID=A0A0D0BW48_9AGAR|nr:hypothetical protein GYMLUDRAFT_183639 [Collybiopsis luxurians FD-317 M1]
MGEEELDNRIRSLPPAFGVRHFKNGISALAQVSGGERKHMARILLSCLVGKIDSRGITACRSLLHFIHLAQYPSHDEETLRYMQVELDTWHQYRSFFITSGTREDFNIPKFHSLTHYIESIRLLGTTDNYNTELFERLHIDFAKEGWRASNKRDHFPQMVKWLSRQEKIASYDFYRAWLDEPSTKEPEEPEPPAGQGGEAEMEAGHISIAKYPPEPAKSLARILVCHAAPGFMPQLKLYLNSLLPSPQQVPKRHALNGILPFSHLDVWHQYKFMPSNLVGRLRVIFRLPQVVDRDGFMGPAPPEWPREPLAYITWFTRFKSSPDKATGMYRVEPAADAKGMLLGSIISLSDIRQGCMLTPSKANWDSAWNTDNILDNCDSFFVNNLQSKYAYQTIY